MTDELTIRELTTRQREVLAHLCAGVWAKEIAVELGIAYGTVRNHLRDIHRRLGVRSSVEACYRFGHCGGSIVAPAPAPTGRGMRREQV